MITLNNNTSEGSNLLLLSRVPNIINVEQAMYSSTPAYGTITVGTVSADTGKYIAVNGLTITSVQNNPEGRKFLLNADQASTAFSIMQALKTIPDINGKYDVYISESNSTVVYIRAKQSGAKYNLSISTNIQGIALNTYGADQQGWNLDVITCDVYENGQFNASLEKDVAGASTSFDISPVLTPEYNSIDTCTAVLRGVNPNSLVASLDTFSFKAINGYRVNNGPLYLQANNQMAAYLGRGTLKSGCDNRTELYTSSNKPLVFSYINLTSTSLQFEISYLTSALETAATDTLTLSGQTAGIIDVEYSMDNYMGSDIYFVDVATPDGYVCRWNVIRPDKAAESVSRLLWRNCYGGISFFDFTSTSTEKIDLDRREIEHSLYDIYTADIHGNKEAYKSRSNIKLTMTTHLIDKDGTYIFNDLAKSDLIWLEKEGSSVYVDLSDIKVTEQDVNDVYQVSVDVEYRG